MTSTAILPYPIESIAERQMDPHLAQAMLSSVAEYGALLHGRRVWLACSGGRDSLALAALCVQLYKQDKLPFLPQLLHVDHGLQSDSSAWAVHVASWAKAQQLSCHILYAQVQGQDEQAARQARYEVMRAHINQDDVLLLAHHADDQAETVLMRLIQGAGVTGLSGMQPWRVQTHGIRRNVLWRPWLSESRAHISAYAQRLKLPYIDDPTNAAGDNVRSGLRAHVMPALAKYNPNVTDNMARSAQLLGDAAATVSAQAAEDLQQIAISRLLYSSAQRAIDIDKLQILPLYRQRQVLHHWLAQDEPLPPPKQLIEDTLYLSQRSSHDHQTALFWQGRKQSYTIRRYRQQLYRLSDKWLDWLKTPLTVTTQLLTQGSLTTCDATERDITKCSIKKNNASKGHTNKHSATDNRRMAICLRSCHGIGWHLKLPLCALSQLSDEIKEAIAPLATKTQLNITPLERHHRLQTPLATRPQSGKKLYQTLGIPVWLRESVVVVSLTFIHETKEGHEASVERPILLLSPFERWALEVETDTTSHLLTELIESHLSGEKERL